ncbi:MAG TPA: DUF1592 domain-containing protein [Polyangia bacterium]|jgi:hypothetical protein
MALATAALAGCTGKIGSAGGGGSGPLPPGLAGPINPGRVVAHRLNNVEYDNTVRDLVGLDLAPSTTYGFPDDAYVEGFDNNADALTAPPLLLEKLETATQAIVDAVMSTAAGNAAVRGRIMVCDPAKAGESACATQILTAFASRAFRRPVAAADMATYANLIAVAKSVGDGFEQGVAAGLRAILLSPRFLFRIEANPGAGKNAPLDDYEIASRLSYFLWSSMPDDALFARAAGGALHDGAGIVDEVKRMLADAKSAALVDNLAGEWLGTRQLAVQQVTLTDVTFDDALRAAMAGEASLFLGELLHGGHAIKELLAANFLFANDRLAAHYGLTGAGTLGSTLTKLALTDSRRGAGILTEANTLTVTSMRDRTSPTRRGKWVSENLLCVVIPPPPPMIPPLDPPSTTAPMSVRDRLAAHRAKGSSCNGCHQYIDPIGFGLEHFDAVGRWRDTDSGIAIDATGNLPGSNAPFDGAVSLAAAVGDDPRFLDCMVRKFMTYAVGRTLVTAPSTGSPMDDTAGLADIRAQLGSSAARLDQLIQLIAASPAMTMRIGEESQ